MSEDNPRLSTILRACKRAGLDSTYGLENLINQLKADEAYSLNESGFDNQVRYILTAHNGPDMLRELLADQGVDPFAQWMTTCPACNGPLYVTEATLSATRERLKFKSPLEQDGYSVSVEGISTCSVEDETVTCDVCRQAYKLDELQIEAPITSP
jgi:uncharacterized protein YbaR (Trm112 family)